MANKAKKEPKQLRLVRELEEQLIEAIEEALPFFDFETLTNRTAAKYWGLGTLKATIESELRDTLSNVVGTVDPDAEMDRPNKKELRVGNRYKIITPASGPYIVSITMLTKKKVFYKHETGNRKGEIGENQIWFFLDKLSAVALP